MALDGVLSSNVEELMVDAFIASLNLAVTLVVVVTPVAPLAGVAAVTVGGVVSAGAAVLNVQVTSDARALPALSLAPDEPPLTLALNVCELANGDAGSSVATRVLEL
jgi:hypothetical protein